MTRDTEGIVIVTEQVDSERGHLLGAPIREPIEETVFEGIETVEELRGELYRFSVREFGRCISKVYVDTDGNAVPVGYVFQKRREYDDSPDTYLQETWVTLERVTEPAQPAQVAAVAIA